MAIKDGMKVQDLVVAQMVDCAPPEESAEKRAFRAGYQAALRQNYPGKIGAEEQAWREWNESDK